VTDPVLEKILDAYSFPEIDRRFAYSTDKFHALRKIAEGHWRTLSQHASDGGVPAISERACIYVTGSVARAEASADSDLDLFIMDEIEEGAERLSYVENAHLVSTLDRIRIDADFQPFSGGGKWISTHSLQQIVKETGSPEDDAKNTFTARILLLLNSKPILNDRAYERARTAVLDRYWQSADRSKSRLPIMLINDIRRWWGVLGLNFEKYYTKAPIGNTGNYGTTPEREYANLKLRYARLLACYSPILLLLHRSDDEGVKRDHAEEILSWTPIERLTALYDAVPTNIDIRTLIERVMRGYDDHLEFVSMGKSAILEALKEEKVRREKKDSAYGFHRDFVRLLNEVGDGKTLYDYVIV